MTAAQRSVEPSAQRIVELVTPEQHYRAVVTDQRNEHLLWARGRKERDGREWHRLPPEWAREALAKYHNEPDIFFTPNEFYGWRLIRLLAALNAFFVDIDVHEGQGCPVRAGWNAIHRIQEAHLPPPNMVVYTGRGAHLYWLFERTPKQALPRWQHVQKVLVQLTSGDTQVLDATRVLRLVGTQNSQADEGRRTVTAEVLNPERYRFDWLCDQILHTPRAEIRDLQAARALRQARSPAPTPKQAAQRTASMGSIYQVWYHRYQDLIKISDAYWFGGVPPGYRNMLLLHKSIALSWFTRAEALEDEIMHVARHNMPSFTESEIRSTVSSVLKRASDAASGKMYEFNGMPVDPRYRFKSDTQWEIWGPLVEAMPGLESQLRAIISPQERKRREGERQEARDRTAEGRYQSDRAQYRQKAEQRRTEAAGLLEKGFGAPAVAAQTGLSIATVYRSLPDAMVSQAKAAKSPPKDGVSPARAAYLAKTEQRREAATELLQQGLAVAVVAEQTGLSAATIYRLRADCPAPILKSLKSAPLVLPGASAECTTPEPMDKAGQARKLKQEGHSVRQIADLIGISKSQADRLLKSYPQAEGVPEHGELSQVATKSAPLVCGRSPARSAPLPGRE